MLLLLVRQEWLLLNERSVRAMSSCGRDNRVHSLVRYEEGAGVRLRDMRSVALWDSRMHGAGLSDEYEYSNKILIKVEENVSGTDEGLRPFYRKPLQNCFTFALKNMQPVPPIQRMAPHYRSTILG